MFPLHTSQESNKTHTSDTLFMDFLFKCGGEKLLLRLCLLKETGIYRHRSKESGKTVVFNEEGAGSTVPNGMSCAYSCSNATDSVLFPHVVCYYTDHISFYSKSLIHIHRRN